MASSYDEYDYLERQVDAQLSRPQPRSHSPLPAQASRAKPSGGTASDDDNNKRRRSRSRSRSRDCKSRRSSRSRSRDRRRRSRSPSQERSRSYSDRYRSSRRSPPRRRSPTPPAERLAREKERELRELERAARTIFVYNLSLRVEERDLFGLFSKVGRVVDIRLITDKNTKKSRGLAYVEYSKVDEVMSAVALTGNILMGQPVMVKASEAEKNMAWEAAQQQKQSTQTFTQQLLDSLASTSGSVAPPPSIAAAGPCWLNVSSLHKDLCETEILQLFLPFGELLFVQVVRDAQGRSTGVAHLQFKQMDAAARAMSHWHRRKLMDGQLTVTAMAPPTLQLQNLSLAPVTTVLPGLLPVAASLAGGTAAGLPLGVLAPIPVATLPTAVAPSAGAAVATAAQTAVVTTGELDEDDEGGGIKMSAQSRVALMSKLAGSAGLTLPPAYVTPTGFPAAQTAAAPTLAVDPVLLMQQGVLGPSSPIATPCLLLKNMFDAAPMAGDAAAQSAAAATLTAEVEADVREESSRFGELVHVWVDPRSKGFVYLRFSKTQSAEAAHRALHGRWYGGRQIVAEYQFLQVYNSHFKLQQK